MPGFYRFLALSPHPIARMVRATYRGISHFSLPAPRVIVRPMLWVFVTTRQVFYFLKRVLICEPLFKAYCKSYGKNLHTGVFVHWVQGQGDIIVGDHVEIDGKISIQFAARFSPDPTLRIGDHTIVRNQCTFVVCKKITIGRHCKIASGVLIFESNGHPSDPEQRMAGLPPRTEEVRPVTIGDNVWIGQRSIITPGVTIGEGSIVSANSVVLSDVPPYTVVAGYPARKIASLRNPHLAGNPPEPLPAGAG